MTSIVHEGNEDCPLLLLTFQMRNVEIKASCETRAYASVEQANKKVGVLIGQPGTLTIPGKMGGQVSTVIVNLEEVALLTIQEVSSGNGKAE